jgi:hypothetical protein
MFQAFFRNKKMHYVWKGNIFTITIIHSKSPLFVQSIDIQVSAVNGHNPRHTAGIDKDEKQRASRHCIRSHVERAEGERRLVQI